MLRQHRSGRRQQHAEHRVPKQPALRWQIVIGIDSNNFFDQPHAILSQIIETADERGNKTSSCFGCQHGLGRRETQRHVNHDPVIRKCLARGKACGCKRHLTATFSAMAESLRPSASIFSGSVAVTSALTGPSTIAQISAMVSPMSRPDLAISDGFVVTPSIRPVSARHGYHRDWRYQETVSSIKPRGYG